MAVFFGFEECFRGWAIYRVAQEAGHTEAVIAQAMRVPRAWLYGYINGCFALTFAGLQHACQHLAIPVDTICAQAVQLRDSGKLPDLRSPRQAKAKKQPPPLQSFTPKRPSQKTPVVFSLE